MFKYFYVSFAPVTNANFLRELLNLLQQLCSIKIIDYRFSRLVYRQTRVFSTVFINLATICEEFDNREFVLQNCLNVFLVSVCANHNHASAKRWVNSLVGNYFYGTVDNRNYDSFSYVFAETFIVWVHFNRHAGWNKFWS